MLKKYYYENMTWYHFSKKSTTLSKKLTNNLKIDAYTADYFNKKLNKNKTFAFKNSIFLSLTIPNLVNGEYEKQKIKFILGKNYMISSSDDEDSGLDDFIKYFKKNTNLKKSDEFENLVIYSFVNVVEKIYENMIDELENTFEEIEKIEKKIFSGNSKKMVKTISETNKKLIDFKKHIRNNEEIWEIFIPLSKTLFNKKHSTEAFHEIRFSHGKVIAEMNSLKDSIIELRNTNNSLLNSQVADTTKTFTLIAFLTLPITLFISILSIPTKGHFLDTSDNNFFGILIISGILFIITLIISKLKKWW